MYYSCIATMPDGSVHNCSSTTIAEAAINADNYIQQGALRIDIKEVKEGGGQVEG